MIVIVRGAKLYEGERGVVVVSAHHDGISEDIYMVAEGKRRMSATPFRDYWLRYITIVCFPCQSREKRITRGDTPTHPPSLPQMPRVGRAPISSVDV